MTKSHLCKYPNCDKPSRSRGWCMTHYNRWRRNGTVKLKRRANGAPRPPCAVEGCDNESQATGLCNKHYIRKRKYGSPHETRFHLRADIDRFIEGVLSSDTAKCIDWPFLRTSGYGRLRVNGVRRQAHAYILELATGQDADGRLALHAPVICNNSSCVNPRHLRWGTHSDNNADCIADGNATLGEASANAKLTEEQVRMIRADNRTTREIAQDYGIGSAQVSKIKTRTQWSHLD